MKFDKALQAIENRLLYHQPTVLTPDKLIPAAITIPLFSRNEEAHLLLTLRADTVEHHKGQVSFPGGAREAQDKTIVDTAIRETEEEVGIPPEMIRVIGQLDDFPTISDFLITPIVTTIPYPYPQQINPLEVARLLEVPLSFFLSDKHFEIKWHKHHQQRYPVYYYYFEESVIWGVTGFIINRFIEMVFDYNPAPGSIPGDPHSPDYLRRTLKKNHPGNRKSDGK